MSSHSRVPSTTVRHTTTVAASIDTAFSVFVEQFDLIKPREHNMLSVEIAESVLEPRVDGALYDRGIDGSKCRWGRVLAYEPPHRLRFTWEISPRWQIETDPDRFSEVEIQFIADGPTRTRVQLEHRHLDRHGDAWESLRDGIGGDGGWPLYLERYAELIGRLG